MQLIRRRKAELFGVQCGTLGPGAFAGVVIASFSAVGSMCPQVSRNLWGGVIVGPACTGFQHVSHQT